MKLTGSMMNTSNIPFHRLAVTFVVLAATLALLAQPVSAQDKKSPADEAWRELVKIATPPPPPKEWYTQKPSETELAEFNKMRAAKALEASRKAREFHQQFPADPRAVEARLNEYNLLTAVVELGDPSVSGEVEALEKSLAEDRSLPDAERLSILMNPVRRVLRVKTQAEVGPALVKATELLLQATRMFPAEIEPAANLLQFTDMLMAYDHAELAHEVLKQLKLPGNDPQVIAAASEAIKKFELLGKPVEMAFTSIDGRKVDVADLKGKVVLINYWATWCGPCVASLPELKAAYEKWKPEGFEMLGISLDHELEPLQKMVKDRNLEWPQHYDQQNERNRFAEQFGINSTPTIWLLDRKGNLRNLNARGDMDEKIAKLIAEGK